jgi:hypothetical protein
VHQRAFQSSWARAFCIEAFALNPAGVRPCLDAFRQDNGSSGRSFFIDNFKHFRSRVTDA